MLIRALGEGVGVCESFGLLIVRCEGRAPSVRDTIAAECPCELTENSNGPLISSCEGTVTAVLFEGDFSSGNVGRFAGWISRASTEGPGPLSPGLPQSP